MKKLSVIFSIIFAVLLSLGTQVLPNVFAEWGELTLYISTKEDFISNVKGAGVYVLANNIDFEGESIAPIENFTGTLDGNGYTISNFSIYVNSETNENSNGLSVALFKNTDGATIKNLKIENAVVGLNQTAETVSAKIAILVANASATTIDCCSINGSSNSITAETKTTTYAGGFVANAIGGTKITNCTTSVAISVKNTVDNKNNYIGGIVGYLDNCTLNFDVANVILNLDSIVHLNSYIGGVCGYVIGDRVQIKNIVHTGQINQTSCFDQIKVGTVIGAISCPTLTPADDSINYIYTTIDGEKIGNTQDLQLYFTENLIDFNILTKTINVTTYETLCLKDFYVNGSNFDSDKEWDFELKNCIWQIKTERNSLPSLQCFEYFNYTLSEDASFNSSNLTKPNLGSSVNVINFISNENNQYKYGEQIRVGGYITTASYMNKFFTVRGLRKDDSVIFLNEQVLNVINNENVVITENEEKTVKTYTLSTGEVVTETQTTVNSNSATLYKLAGNDVSWATYSNTTNGETNVYFLENCNLTDKANYSLYLEPIEYTINVATENAEHGTVRRTAAGDNVKNESFEDVVYYGQTLSYTAATTTSDFGFSGWFRTLDKANLISNQYRVSFTFNEKAFQEGGIFYGLNLSEDALNFYATFTKRVCDITIKFAVNDEIKDEILSRVYFGEDEIIEKNGAITVKAVMGQTHKFSVVLPAGYEFSNWFTSDGTVNLGSIGDTLEIELDITENDDALILVANFAQEVEPEQNGSYIVWVIVGVVGVLVVVGLVIFLIIKKKKDNGYKNMYY